MAHKDHSITVPNNSEIIDLREDANVCVKQTAVFAEQKLAMQAHGYEHSKAMTSELEQWKCHSVYMSKALTEARRAFDMGEVPIGCVIVHEGEIIGIAANERATKKNVLAHAEIMAIDQACKAINDWRLENCTLYVTLEPCPMCAGAIVQARIPMVVYGAKSPKAGCAGSILDILNEPRFNHRVEVVQGVMEKECAGIMSEFFTRFR